MWAGVVSSDLTGPLVAGLTVVEQVAVRASYALHLVPKLTPLTPFISYLSELLSISKLLKFRLGKFNQRTKPKADVQKVGLK